RASRRCNWACWSLLNWARLSCVRSRMTSRCSPAIFRCEAGALLTLPKKLATGRVTAPAMLSADPKIAPPIPRRPPAGPAVPARESKVISAKAATSSTPRIRRVRRLSCTGPPHPRRCRGWPPNAASAPGLWHQHLPQRVEILHALAGTQYHGIKRVIGHVDGHPRFLAQALVHPAQQRSASGQRDPPVHHVAGQLGGALVERRLDRVHDERERLLDGPADLLRRDHDGLRQPADQIPAADLRVRLVGQGEGRPQRHLDLFGGALAQHERILLLAEGDDG